MEIRHALSAWIRAKESLQRVMPPEDFHHFVRPMYLIGVLSKSFLLIALPPNQRIVERARNFQPNLRAAIQQQGYDFAGFTPYPSDEVVMLLANNRHPGLTPLARMICARRLPELMRRRASENARDSAPLEVFA